MLREAAKSEDPSHFEANANMFKLRLLLNVVKTKESKYKNAISFK